MWILLKTIWRFYTKHIAHLTISFHAILNDKIMLENIRNRKYRRDYIFPFMLTSAIVLDTAIQYLLHGYNRKKLIFFNQIVMKFMPEILFDPGGIVY